MPYSFMGTGTLYYGKRDFKADGSYVTTEWFCLLGLPLAPIRSVCVIEAGPVSESRRLLTRDVFRTYQSHSTRLSVRQVASVYGYVLGFGCLAVSAWSAMPLAVIAVSILWGFAPFLLRKRAKSNLQQPLVSDDSRETK